MDVTLERIIEELKLKKIKKTDLTDYLGFSSSAIFGNWISGRNTSYLKYLHAIANYLNVSVEYLRGETDDKRPQYGYAPTVTADFTTFPVIGEVAAGYDHIAVEDWDGDTVDIPNSYLRGRDPSEYFVLKVIGDSMLPKYEDGDRVLVHRQSSMDHSGQIGVVLYDGNIGTLKKVEYVMGEDWMELIPLNDAFSSVKIKGSALEQCRVLGVPKLLIREIED